MEEAFFPVVVLINTIPVVAKAPILVLLLGNGMEPKIAIAALICFFPTLVNMVRGLESVNPQAMELMRVLSAASARCSSSCGCRTRIPYLFSALKIAASTAVIGAIVGEWIGSTVGIGALIIQATYNFDIAAALRHRDRGLGLLGAVLPRHRAARAPGRPLAAAPTAV